MTRIKSAIAFFIICLCWGTTAQAGFLGNNLELQFLQSLLGNASINVTVTHDVEVPNGPGGVSIDIDDSWVNVVVPGDIVGEVGLNIIDLTPSHDPIIGATTSGVGTVSSGADNVMITDLPAGSHHVEVIFAVPEPGALGLFTLGLALTGLTAYRRRQERL